MIFQCDINTKWEVVGFAAKSALQYLLGVLVNEPWEAPFHVCLILSSLC